MHAAPAGEVRSFSVGHDLSGAVSGPDGNLWMLDTTNDRLLRMTLSGEASYVTVPDAGTGLVGLTAGPDGNLWTTAPGANLLIRVTPEGQVTSFPLTPLGGSVFKGIATGPDGNLWVGMTDTSVSPLANHFARVSTSGTDGAFFTAGTGWFMTGIVSATSGVYFVHNTGAAVGRVQSDGTFTTVPGAGVTYGVAEGPDRQVWTADYFTNALRAWTPGAGSSSSYGTAGGSFADALAAGADGNVWYFTTPGGTRTVARMSTDGTARGSFASGVPGAGGPIGMTTASDGSMWVAFTGGSLARVGTGVDDLARASVEGSGVVGTDHRCALSVQATGLGAVRSQTVSWWLDGTRIAGADGAIYVPARDLTGKALRCRVSATFEVGLTQAGFMSAATVLKAPADASGGGGSSPAAAPKRLKATWARTGAKVSATFRPVAGAPRNVIRATRKGARARTGTCTVRKVKRTRSVTCRITLPKGRWTVSAEARRGATAVARATRTYRIG
ncbi:MAG: hypothetical protein ACKORG_05890 [Actinomycetota bacterium]